jgi:hypothetical protein
LLQACHIGWRCAAPDEKDDRALKEALDLLRGTVTDAAFPPNSKAAVPN